MSCTHGVHQPATVHKTKIGSLIGRLDDETMVRLNRAIIVFLGLAGPSPWGVKH